MSANTGTAVKEKKSKPILSKEERKALTEPINVNNPVIVQILGICSALAVTIKLKNALMMVLGVTVVTAFSNLVISILRNYIPSRVRIVVELVVISALVILVDYLLKGFVYDVSKQLSVYVGLIITNCIVMGRLEAYALNNKPLSSFLDGIGNGFGYGWILLSTAFIRELLGKGELFGYSVMPAGYVPNGILIMPLSSLFVIGVIIWLHKWRNPQLIEK